MTAPLVLVVDDDVDFLETVALVLQSRGYEVATATSGDEALRRLEAGLAPALILLDLMMPGMHGWEFRERQLKSPDLATIPLVVLSGDHMALRRLAPTGVDERLPKPVELQTLLDTVGRHVRPGASESV